jgi:hypothetical protein
MSTATRTVKGKFDGDASGIIAAAKAAEKAVDGSLKDTEKKFGKSGDKAGKGFSANLRKWLTGKGMKDAGQTGGTVFGSGFLGMLKTPILGPALVAAIGAAALTALPAVGAIAGGALVTGFGAGIAGLGIAFAAQADAVQAKWKATTTQLGRDMRLISKPFESTLINIADIFERTVDRFNPHLAKSFSQMAPVVERFVDQTARALEELIPAIDPITDAFANVLDSLGPAMQSMLRDVSAGMQDLANSVRANPDALADMVRGIGSVSRTALDLVTTLSNVNGKFREMTGGVSLVQVTMRVLQSTMSPLIGLFKGVEKGIDLVNAAMHSTAASGASMSEAANATVKLAQGYQGAAGPAKAFDASIRAVSEAAARQASQFTAAINAMMQWNDAAIAGSNAAISYQAAVDAATSAVKANGRTLDIGTEKGRANQTALNQLADAANRQTQAMDAAGRSNVSVAATAERARANFIRVATQMGATVPQAKRMADAMINIPNVSREAKLTANKKDLEKKLAAARRELADPNLTKKREAQLRAEISNLMGGIARARSALAGLPSSRTVTLTTRHVTERIVRTQTASGGGRAPGFASGGIPPVNRPYLVGEEGPELRMDRVGGRILSAKETAEALKGAGSGGGEPMVAEIHIEIGGEVVRVVRTEIKADKRDTKRRVGAR